MSYGPPEECGDCGGPLPASWTGEDPYRCDDCREPAVGDRVRLTAPMLNPGSEVIPDEGMPAGCEGTIDWIGTVGGQIGVRWDNGRRLLLLADTDGFEVLR